MGILKDAIKKVALAGLAGGILIVISMGIVEYIYPHVHGTIGMIILLLILVVFCIAALTDDTIILRVVELPLGGLALVPESLVNPAIALIAFIILLVIVLFVAAIILTVLVMAALFAAIGLATFLIFSGILYPFAKKFGGEGSFAEQTYAMSSYFSPLILIESAVVSSQILFHLTDVITSIALVIITICSLYPLTLVLKRAHKYDTKSASLTWFLPATGYIICAIAVVFIMYPNLTPAPSPTPTPAPTTPSSTPKVTTPTPSSVFDYENYYTGHSGVPVGNISATPSDKSIVLIPSESTRFSLTPVKDSNSDYYFTDYENGWYVNSTTLHSSPDGGKTWYILLTVENLPKSYYHQIMLFHDVERKDGRHLIIVLMGDEQSYIESVDEGRSWRHVNFEHGSGYVMRRTYDHGGTWVRR